MSTKKRTEKASSPTTLDLGGRADSTEKVSRVRDLIFGQEMRNYEQKFEHLTRDVQRLQNELNQLTTQLSEQGARLSQQVSEQDERLTTRLSTQEKEQSQRVQALAGQFTRELQESDQKHAQNEQELRQELRVMEDGLRTDLREAVQQLADQKADRLALGDMFIELGTLLKNQDSEQIMVSLLDELEGALD